MKNENDTTSQPYKITFSLVLGWLLGTFFALGGLVLLFTEPVPGLLMLVLAALLLPPVNQLVASKLNITISGPLKFVGVVALIIAIAVSANDPQAGSGMAETSDASQEQAGDMLADARSDDSATSNTANQPPEIAETPAGPKTQFENGTHVVGVDIAPGTYRSSRSGTCYWARLSGFGGELGDIIGNGNNSPQIVTITASDEAFESMGCGQWQLVEDTFPSAPSTSFSDGTYVVGEHIAPGRYRADGSPDRICYWARLSSFSQGGIDGIITNGNSPTVIEIAPSDTGFSAFGCGTWSQI